MEFTEFEPLKLPTSFRVIGFGAEAKAIADKLNGSGYDGLEAVMADESSQIYPTDVDKMVIVLVTDHPYEAALLSKAFYQAGVLTVVVASDDFSFEECSMDTLTVEPVDRMYETVKTLVDTIFQQGRINYDFTDLARTLRNTGHFAVYVSYGYGTEDRIAEAIGAIPAPVDELKNSIENMSLIITCNHDMEPPLTMHEILPLNGYMESFPDCIDIVWTLQYDKSMAIDTLKISVIVAGKGLKMRCKDLQKSGKGL